VKAAAQKLGYVPDPAARALASRRGSHVAVLIPMLSNNLFVDVLEAVQQTLRPLGYQSLIGITHYDAAEEEQLLREQLQHRPAGVLLTGLDRSESTRALLRDSGVPCVHMMETTQGPASTAWACRRPLRRQRWWSTCWHAVTGASPLPQPSWTRARCSGCRAGASACRPPACTTPRWSG
jgi:hypothetical protein